MINHLLATIFFRIDILLLKPLKGDTVVGYYGAALKYIDGLIVIPSFFTMAIFPLMSRYATSARESLLRAYVLSLRLLLMLALPVAIGTPFIARELILILGGGEYLPHSMIALQLLIGFFPLSCITVAHRLLPPQLYQPGHPICAHRPRPATLSDQSLYNRCGL
jgi:O-antigen/teichoic acid export membrane protein